VTCIPSRGGHPWPFPAPGRAAVTHGCGRSTPPRLRYPGHAHHRVVLSDRLLGVIGLMSGVALQAHEGGVVVGVAVAQADEDQQA